MATDTGLDLDEDLETELDDDPEADPVIDGEQRAKAMGWKPLAEFRGDPRRWTDWPEFIRKGEEELPILRAQSHRMSDRIIRLEGDVEKMRLTVTDQAQAVQDAMSIARKAGETGYKRALAELKAQQREAVEGADTVAFNQIEAQIDALETTRKEVEAVPERKPAPRTEPEVDPIISQFVAENRWFNNAAKAYLKAAMIGMHNAVIAEGEIVNVADQLAEAKDRLAGLYPQDFPRHVRALADDPDPDEPPRRRPAPASVLRPASGEIPRKLGPRGSPFDRIEDANEREQIKSAFKRMQSMDPGLTAEEYMVLHDDPHADVLAIRQARKPRT